MLDTWQDSEVVNSDIAYIKLLYLHINVLDTSSIGYEIEAPMYEGQSIFSYYVLRLNALIKNIHDHVMETFCRMWYHFILK